MSHNQMFELQTSIFREEILTKFSHLWETPTCLSTSTLYKGVRRME